MSNSARSLLGCPGEDGSGRSWCRTTLPLLSCEQSVNSTEPTLTPNELLSDVPWALVAVPIATDAPLHERTTWHDQPNRARDAVHLSAFSPPRPRPRPRPPCVSCSSPRSSSLLDTSSCWILSPSSSRSILVELLPMPLQLSFWGLHRLPSSFSVRWSANRVKSQRLRGRADI